MKNELETITVGVDDKRYATLLPGKHDSRFFNECLLREDPKASWVNSRDLKHEYWRKDKRGWWKKSRKGHNHAIPVTVVYW